MLRLSSKAELLRRFGLDGLHIQRGQVPPVRFLDPIADRRCQAGVPPFQLAIDGGCVQEELLARLKFAMRDFRRDVVVQVLGRIRYLAPR